MSGEVYFGNEGDDTIAEKVTDGGQPPTEFDNTANGQNRFSLGINHIELLTLKAMDQPGIRPPMR